jgi:hypothetical protein
MKLGQRAKDKITGLEGFLIGKASYITGCDQYLIQPELKDGNHREGRWIDEGRIEILGEGISLEDVASDSPGCDIPAPIK